MREFKKIEGKTKVSIMLFALSTCVWCKKAKKLLEELNATYSYIDMDLIDDDVKEKFLNQLKQWNPTCSYPTLIVNDKECIVGFDEEKIRKALK